MTTPTDAPEHARIGCATIAAPVFVAIFWTLTTVAAVLRSRVVGFPGLYTDEGAWGLWAFSLGMLSLVLVYRDEIVKPGTAPCPKCGGAAQRGQFALWQFLLVILVLPLGLLSLLAGREPSVCPHCGHVWE